MADYELYSDVYMVWKGGLYSNPRYQRSQDSLSSSE